MKGKFRKLCLAVLIPLLLLAGCGQGKEQAKEQSPEELLKEVISNQKQFKSGKLHMTMNFKAAVPLEEAQELLGDVQESALQMDMDADMELSLIHISSSWIFSRARFLEVACFDLEALAENLEMNSCNSLIFSSFFRLASFICLMRSWLDSYQKS